MTHYAEDELTLYYYGEARRPADVERHLGQCASCAATYRAIAGTLAMIVMPEIPERGDLYGLEVWQRIRHQLPVQDASWTARWFTWNRLTLVAAAATFCLAVALAFVAGRVWQGGTTQPLAPGAVPQAATENDARQRVLVASFADHLDRSDRILTEIMNTPAGRDISAEQRWAADLLTTSRLYRQDATASGEQSVANVLDVLTRSREGLKRIQQIVGDLREFSRHEAMGDLQDSVDLNPGIVSTINIVRGRARARKVELEMELGHLPGITCQAAKIT